jgi:hypothetical protein
MLDIIPNHRQYFGDRCGGFRVSSTSSVRRRTMPELGGRDHSNVLAKIQWDFGKPYQRLALPIGEQHWLSEG